MDYFLEVEYYSYYEFSQQETSIWRSIDRVYDHASQNYPAYAITTSHLATFPRLSFLADVLAQF